MSLKYASVATAVSAAMVPLLMSSHAYAADESFALEEIVVTATRQATASQDTALALTAVSGEELLKQGVTNLSDLAKVTPSMYVQEGISSASTRFSLRGVSSQDINFDGQSPIAIYFDDVYQTALYGLSNQLFDVGRVEVLRGPQGTLFGKNSTGGAVSYYAQEPEFNDSGYAGFKLADGTQSQRNVEGAINTQLIDGVLAVRLSAKMEHLGDYARDAILNRGYGESDSQAIRGQLKWTPSDTTTVNLTLSANDYDGQSQVFHVKYLPTSCDGFLKNSGGGGFYLCDGTVDQFGPIFPVPANAAPKPTPELNPDTVALNDMAMPETFWNQSAVLRINQDMGWGNITSISHYKRGQYHQINDGEGAPGDFFDLFSRNRSQQIGEELRLATDAQKMFSGVAGVYYQHDRFNDETSFTSFKTDPVFPGAPPFGSDYNQAGWATNRTTTWALFGALTYKVTDDLSLVAGVRRSDERRRRQGITHVWAPNPLGANFVDWTPENILLKTAEASSITSTPPDWSVPEDVSLRSKVTTWDFTVNYKPMEDMLLFVRAAKGFRAGGFNGLGLFSTSSTAPFRPEFIKSYEAGIKSEYMNNRLRVNATVYHYDYTDQQVQTFASGAALVANAGKSKVDGVELEVKALPVRALELGGSVSFTQATYKSYPGTYNNLDPALVGVGLLDVFGDPVEIGSTVATDFKGKRLNQSPKWTANAYAAYTVDVSSSYDVRASTNWSYRSVVYFDPSNDPALSSPGQTIGNVRVELEPQEGKGLSVALFVDNLNDKRYVTYAFGFRPAFDSYTFSNGRKYGAEMKYAW